MTAVDRLWYLADEAEQLAEQTYHGLADAHDDPFEFSKQRWISRERFRVIVDRITDNGLPYGAHAIVTREDGAVLLVRHAMVDSWVLPGGEVDGEESFEEAARRELREEAGIEATFEGLGLLGRVEFRGDQHSTWGVLPIYAARAETTDLTVEDPDGEIVDAQWVHTLPEDTRDRSTLEAWCERNVWA
jgi:8-oxo-dGTP diphosphatase